MPKPYISSTDRNAPCSDCGTPFGKWVKNKKRYCNLCIGKKDN